MMQRKSMSVVESDISILQADMIQAAVAVKEAGNAVDRMLRSFSQLGLHNVMESVEAGTVILEILTDGAYPLPVGSQGTAPITNNSTVPLAVKIGDKAPNWFGPGAIILTIPPGESAAVQKISPNAPELQTQIVRWISTIRPCVPGQICGIGDWIDWQQNKKIGADQDAVPILVGWGKPIVFGGDPTIGFTLGPRQ
jgi:hypothetical protein